MLGNVSKTPADAQVPGQDLKVAGAGASIRNLGALYRSRLCRRIMATVFGSLVVVEAALLLPWYGAYQSDLLARLEGTARTEVISAFRMSGHGSKRDLTNVAKILMRNSGVRGATVFDDDGAPWVLVGEAVSFTAGQTEVERVRSADGERYDIFWPAEATGLPFAVAGRMDAAWIAVELNAFLLRVALLSFGVVLLVAIATIMIIDRQVLQPILRLRAHLIAAQVDPAHADSYMLTHRGEGEIGDMVGALNTLLERVSQTRRDDLEASENRFRDFATAASDWFWETDAEHRYVWFSENIQWFIDFPRERLYGKSRMEIVQPNIGQEAWNRHLVQLEARQPFHDFEYRTTARDRLRWIRISGVPVFDAEQRFLGYRGTGRDITELKQAADQVERAEQRLRDAIDVIAESFLLFDSSDRLVLHNESFGRRYGDLSAALRPGLRFSEYIDLIAAKVLPQDSTDAVREAWRRQRMAYHDNPEGFLDTETRGDSWVRASECRTPDGGTILLVSDISNLKRREEELKTAKTEAETASHAKSQFLANMSHELRTPLNSILGFSELIRGMTLDEAATGKFIEYASDIHAGGEHLLAVINDILDLAKIDAGRIDLHDAEIDVESFCEQVIRVVKQEAEEADVRITCVVRPDDLRVQADPTRLRQVLLNLLSNAVAFTERGGEVALTVETGDGGDLVIAVRDTGIGIKPEHLDLVLEPFAQVADSLTRSHGGSGLGLPISRSLVELHDGRLLLDSTWGEGTIVSVVLPKSRVIAKAA